MHRGAVLALLLAAACGGTEDTPPKKPKEAAPLVTATHSARGILHPRKEERTGELLVEDILVHVAPGIWETDGVSIEIRNRTLTVTAPQAVHDELAKYLEERRAAALREDR
ncbi:MAG: hypothetical protein ACYTG3_20235 [Planctomycetota bacterium]|jgi:hypothetical protein